MKLTMVRKGTFKCNWSNGNGKCGVGDELRPTYSYECHIETADLLDGNGFIYDQLDIDKYFQTKYSSYQTPKSCERLAIDAVKDVRQRIENHMLATNGMSVLYKICVTIGVGENPPAKMTCEWTPEAAKQVANVKKVKKTPKKDPNDPAAMARQILNAPGWSERYGI